MTMSAEKGKSASAAAAIFAAGAVLQGAVFTAPVDAASFDSAAPQQNVGWFNKDVKQSAGNAVQDAGNAAQRAASKVSDALPSDLNLNKDNLVSSAKGAAGQAQRAASDVGSSNQQGSRALDHAKVAGDALKESLGSAGSSGSAASGAVGAAKDAGNKAKQAASNLGSSNVLSSNDIASNVKQGLKSATSAVSSTADAATNSKAVPNTWSSGGSKSDVVASAKGAANQAKNAASKVGSNLNSNSNNFNANSGGDKGAFPNGGGSPALDQAKVAGQAFSDSVGAASNSNPAGNIVSDAKGAAGQAKQAASSVKSSLGSNNLISLNFGKPGQNKNAGDLNPRNAPTIADGIQEAGQGIQRNADKAQNIASSNANKVSEAGGEFGDALSQAGSTLKGKAEQAGNAMDTKDAFGNDKKAGGLGSNNLISLNFGKPGQSKNVGDANPKNAPTLKDGLKQASKGAVRNADKAQEIVKNNAANVPGAGEDLSDAVARAGSSVKGEAKQGIKNLGTNKGW